jgi:hypothetical protein
MWHKCLIHTVYIFLIILKDYSGKALVFSFIVTLKLFLNTSNMSTRLETLRVICREEKIKNEKPKKYCVKKERISSSTCVLTTEPSHLSNHFLDETVWFICYRLCWFQYEHEMLPWASRHRVFEIPVFYSEDVFCSKKYFGLPRL